MSSPGSTFRELYVSAKAKREARPRNAERQSTGLRYVGPGKTSSPDKWFTGVWTEAEVDTSNVDHTCSQPRSPKSSKWNSMETDLLDHCASDADSPLLPTQVFQPSQRKGRLLTIGRSLPRSAPTADGGRGGVEAGTIAAISALQPWLLAMRGKALGALAFPSECVWLRACLVGWYRLSGHDVVTSLAGRCESLVICSLSESLEALHRFAESPSVSSVGVVLRLRHLHNILSEEWAERIAEHGSDSENCESQVGRANSIRMDSSSSVYFHRRLHRLLAHWPPECPPDTVTSHAHILRSKQSSRGGSPKASSRVGSPRTSSKLGSPRASGRKPRLRAEELGLLKETMVTEGCFQRLRGALALVAGIWHTAFEKTQESAFRAAAKRADSVGFTLDAVNLALPGEIHGGEEVTFTKWPFARLEELPPELLEALQQLGPL